MLLLSKGRYESSQVTSFVGTWCVCTVGYFLEISVTVLQTDSLDLTLVYYGCHRRVLKMWRLRAGTLFRPSVLIL